jgi:hypothetical protein
MDVVLMSQRRCTLTRFHPSIPYISLGILPFSAFEDSTSVSNLVILPLWC